MSREPSLASDLLLVNAEWKQPDQMATTWPQISGTKKLTSTIFCLQEATQDKQTLGISGNSKVGKKLWQI